MKKRIITLCFVALLSLSACTSQLDTEPIEVSNDNSAINTILIEGENYERAFVEDRTVYAMMLLLKEEELLSFEAKDYGELGFLIEKINGVSNSVDEDLYWIYYINDNQSNMGVSQYVLEPNDLVEWRYESYN